MTNTTTLTVSASAVIAVNGTAGSLTVTNTGTTYPASNVSVALPGGWTGVTQDASNCVVIAPNGGTCTLTLTSTAPYVAQGNISVSGDNITTPPTTALAFSMFGYMVYAVPTGSTAVVVGSSDLSSYAAWSPTLNVVPGITETSTVAGGAACNGAGDGACDTGQIATLYGAPYNAYAAGDCHQITTDNSGAVAVGTWYLPAICEMGGSGQGANCPTGEANIDTNLVQHGFIALSGTYWASTEWSSATQNAAWVQTFATGGGSHQDAYNKSGGANSLAVRCVRPMPY